MSAGLWPLPDAVIVSRMLVHGRDPLAKRGEDWLTTYCIHQCCDCDRFLCRRIYPSSSRRARSLGLRDLSCSVRKTSSLVLKAHSTSPERELPTVLWIIVSASSRNIQKRPIHCISHYWGWSLSVVLGVVRIFCLHWRVDRFWWLHKPLYAHCHVVRQDFWALLNIM